MNFFKKIFSKKENVRKSYRKEDIAKIESKNGQISFGYNNEAFTHTIIQKYEEKQGRQFTKKEYSELLSVANATYGQTYKVKQKTSETTFSNEIKNNKSVCLSFKNHSNPNEIINRMLDDRDNLKPFYKFFNDVKELDPEYDKELLEKEYNMAIMRAHIAVDWFQIKQDKDIFPNVRWEESINLGGCKNHEKYWNRVWKSTDPFWRKHKPGDCIDCQCGLSATDDPITDNSDIDTK